MAKMWDPNAKKWVDKPAGSAGVVDPRFRTARVNAPVSVPKWNEQVQAEADYAAQFGDGGGSLEDMFRQFNGGGGGGPTRQQSRDWGYAAARPLERAGQRIANMYGNFAEQQAGAMQGFYEPYFAQAQTSADAQRQAALNYLNQQYGTGQADINAATQAALAAIPETQAYSNVPLVELQQQANPLLASVAGFGAETGNVQAQSAQDAQLAAQLAQMARGSATQLNQAQQAMRSAAMGDVTGNQSRALQQMALQRMAQEADIGGRYQSMLGDIALKRAESGAGIEEARQQLLARGLESLVGGVSDAATQRAKTIAEFGPKPKSKSKNKNRGGRK